MKLGKSLKREGVMQEYRAIVHYYFKKGMEREGIKFLETEMCKKAKELGCHDIEMMQNELDPTHWVGTGIWKDVATAKKFQAYWNSIESHLMKFSSRKPERSFWKIEQRFMEKLKKAA